MTELFGRADPLGHVFLLVKHASDSRMADGQNRTLEDLASASESEFCSRRAKTIVLSARTQVPTGI